ncbi:unnamed protein product [Brachionus calyciflorus]|uniref:Uncharacterized protein n=1 Tax=Brachionus calyciflorus TaxID=104777 RepID=A0A814CQN0_9BILA|nr:unnamed protein product [Brachionus calyciflorus]
MERKQSELDPKFNKADLDESLESDQLKDHALQLYRESVMECGMHRFKAYLLHSSGQKQDINFTHEFREYIRGQNFSYLKTHSNLIFKLLKHFPGFLMFNNNDLKIIMNEHFFSLFALRILDMYRDNEFYLMLDDCVQVDKKLFAFLYDEKSRDLMFELLSNLSSLNLTEIEIGLMFPFILSSIYKNLEKKELMKKVFQYYSDVLFGEFHLNKRGVGFMEKFTYIVCLGPKVNQALMDVDLT